MLKQKSKQSFFIFNLIAIGSLLFLLWNLERGQLNLNWRSHFVNGSTLKGTQPLVMRGGDPYIRALMRTISASEANVSQPYRVIYGGEQVWDLSRHPNRCVKIVNGPNAGNCSTASGRYQFLNRTWDEKAQRYHPRPFGFWIWQGYSFEPEYQDAVVYAWLSDRQTWGVDISQLLQQGKVTQVLRLLSGTWTSLGYGIETNSMSSRLPKIYQQMLSEELGK